MREVRVEVSAYLDLKLGRDFYDSLEPGLGGNFERSVLDDIEELAHIHGIHSIHHKCYRKLTSRFPFGIYYLVSEAYVTVLAILDLRMKPSLLRKQVGKRTRNPPGV